VGDERFCEAIRSQTVLRLRYKGTARIVVPHGHGTRRSGIEVILVYQRSGQSSSGHPEGWKTLRVADVDEVEPLSGRFLRVRADADPSARELGTVHCFAE
jgi:hypothetical protein